MPATSTTLRGLIQALGGARQRSSQRGDRPPSVIASRKPRRPHTPCSLKAAALRLWGCASPTARRRTEPVLCSGFRFDRPALKSWALSAKARWSAT